MSAPVSVLPRGALFARYAKSLMLARGDPLAAAAYCDAQGPSWREVSLALKGVVTPMDAATESLGLAFPIAYDFAAALRPSTLLGKISGVRSVPFNTRLLATTTGATATWAGEGTPTPAGALSFSGGTTLTFCKIVSMSLHTDELVRNSTPSAESVIARDAIDAAREAADRALTDPDNAGTLHRPASVTNGGTAITSTGSTIAALDADLKATVAALTDNGVSTDNAVWLLHPRTATHMGLLRGTGGGLAYAGLGVRGGRLLELPAITSSAIVDASSPSETVIILLAADELLLADDGASRISISTEAAVQADDTPSAGASTMISLFQNGLSGLLAERVICWKMRHAEGCAYVKSVQF